VRNARTRPGAERPSSPQRAKAFAPNSELLRNGAELHWRPSYWDIREARDGTPTERAGLVGLELELQAYAQVLGIQTSWREPSTAPRGDGRIRLGGLRRTDEAPPPGEREAILVANLFVRWEYRPGSNLWLVLTRNPVQTVFDDGTGRVDLRRAILLPASWLAMLKLTLWLDLERPLGQRKRARLRR
jgi:hypothetical protein